MSALQNDRVFIRRVESRDRKRIVTLAKESVSFHTPWISAPTTNQIFRLYMRRVHRTDHEGFVCCLRESKQIIGVFNLNNIVRSAYMSASLGYYVFSQYQNQGYMTEGLQKVVEIAFTELGLHRIEANIQPENDRSKELVKRCGFEYEGTSKALLYINGQWCDHERWVIIDNRAQLLPLESSVNAF